MQIGSTVYTPSHAAQTSHPTPQAEHVLAAGGGGGGGEANRGHASAQGFGVGVYFSISDPGGGGGWSENAPLSDGVRLQMMRNTASGSTSAYCQYLCQHITSVSGSILQVSIVSTD